MSKSEVSSQQYYLTEEIKQIKQYLRESGELQKTKIKRWLQCEHELGTPKHLVSTKVRKEAREELFWTKYQTDYITEIAKEEGFTDSNLDGHKNDSRVNPTSENLNVEVIPMEEIEELAKEPEKLREAFRASKANEDHIRFVADNKKIPLVGQGNRDATIETELPEELETDFYFSLFDLAQQLEDFKDNVLNLAAKVKQFPITDEKINKQRAVETRTFAQFFYGLNKRMMRSLIDEKFAFSEFEWHNTIVKEENYSKHGAAVKSKIEAYTIDPKTKKPVSTGEYRVLTREVVGDNKEEVVENLHDICASVDTLAWLNGWVKWRDIEGFMTQLVAHRRIRLNPKLSSTAFGADSGKEFYDE